MRTALWEAGISLLVSAAILFGSAGRLDWPMAWAFLGLNLALAVVGFLVLDPGLIRERALPGGPTRRWDRWLSGAAFVWLSPLALGVTGLDVGRFGWSPPLPPWLELSALAVFAIGNGIALWAAHTNRFFAAFVRIQTERGHRVIADGPYAFVRHPGYAGALPGYLAAPLALGSLWGVAPACVGAGLFVIRTVREDRVLHEELAGYREYAARVRWRLVPWVW